VEANRTRWLGEVWRSTIGKKIIVAITGIILALFVIAHALGNLHAFQGNGSGGESPIDHYANWLRTIGEPATPRSFLLWVERSILIIALVLHVTAIVQLTRRNQAARPGGQAPAHIQRSLASRTMLWSGILILAFIVFHILQFTTDTIQITPVHSGEVYANLWAAFHKWYFVAIYVGAVLLLGLHLHHALWSITQTMGWEKPNRNTTFRRAAAVIAVGVTVGFAAVPIAFWADALPAPSHESTVTAEAR
jgi:succinate dehydrogenase / fumarate reductase cytochrome b subunit